MLNPLLFHPSKPDQEAGGYLRVKDPRNNGKEGVDCRLKTALVVSVLSLVVTSTTVVFALLWLGSSNAVTSPESMTVREPAIACVSCEQLLVSSSHVDIRQDPLLMGLKRHIQDDVEMCCAYDTQQMSSMLQAVMRRKVPAPLPLPSFNVSNFMFSPVSAHKRIYPAFISKDFGNMDFPNASVTCHFKETSFRDLEHHRGVDVEKEGLRIKHPGLYYIYSSINFRPQSSWPCKRFKYKTFTSTMVRTLAHSVKKEQMLKTSHTCCDSCVNTEESRFTGGLFLLDAGDLIQVKITGYRLVYYEPETSFAGLFMLGSQQEEDADK